MLNGLILYFLVLALNIISLTSFQVTAYMCTLPHFFKLLYKSTYMNEPFFLLSILQMDI